MVAYATRLRLSEQMVDVFVGVVRQLDEAYLEYQREKQRKTEDTGSARKRIERARAKRKNK